MLTRVMQSLATFFLPQKCRACGVLLKDNGFVCPTCNASIQWISEPQCNQCGIPFMGETHSHTCGSCLQHAPPFAWHRSCGIYTPPLSHLLHVFKYQKMTELAAYFAALVIKQHRGLLESADCLIPVPLAKERLKGRTYNQSLLFARKLGHLLGIPVLTHQLQKAHATPPQTQLTAEQRRKNLKDVFYWNGNGVSVEGKRIVLIDDVYTTGSTLSACAKVLQKEKTKEIGTLTIAFNPLKNI